MIDWGLLTLILADNIEGLQFLYSDDNGDTLWVDVPNVDSDSLVVNAGDYLSLLSGVYKRYVRSCTSQILLLFM